MKTSMAATASDKNAKHSSKQGRLPFKVLDIKVALQCPNTPQLKRKRSSSEEEKAAKIVKTENSNSETADIENIKDNNVCKNAPSLLLAVTTTGKAALSKKQPLKTENQTDADAELMRVVEDVLRTSVMEVIDPAVSECMEKEANDDLSSTWNSSLMNSSIQSVDTDSNDNVNDEKSVEIVSENGSALKRAKKRGPQKDEAVGKTKIKRNKEEKEKRKSERERLRQEKEKMMSDAKSEKKRLSEELRLKRHQEKEELKQKKLQEKEDARQKVLMKKEMERKEKEEKIQEKLMVKEKEKEEKQKVLDEKKLLLSLKQEEKKKKEEERQKKLEEKKMSEEEAERKKNKVKDAFVSFFIKNEPAVQIPQEQTHGLFKPFQLKKNMKLASVIPASVSFDPTVLETNLQSQNCRKLYIKELQTKHHKPYRNPTKMEKQNEGCADVVIVENEENIAMRAKLFYFCDNVRPPYWGTWRKKSQVVKPRNPFKKDSIFDYEVDSDEEWDEGGPGESLSGTEEEKESEDDYEVDNEFFVPHGYLSADEEKDEDGDLPDSPEMQKMRLKVREREFEEELKRKCSQLKPCILGCLWSKESNEELYKALAPYQAIVLSSVPVQRKDVCDQNGDNLLSPRSELRKKKLAKAFPEEAMPYFIKLVHANTNGKAILATEFKMFWSMQCEKTDGDAQSEISDTTNKENASKESALSPISKGLVEVTLKKIARYMKNPFHSAKRCWWVHDEIRAKYDLADLPALNRWQYVSRVEAEPLPSQPKTPTGIMKFARKITPTIVGDSPNSTTPSTGIAEPNDITPNKTGIVKVPKKIIPTRVDGNSTDTTPNKTGILKFAKRITPTRVEGSPNATPTSLAVKNDVTPKVKKAPESKSEKKRTMSILEFAKRLKTEDKNEASTSNGLIEKTNVEEREEKNKVPEIITL